MMNEIDMIICFMIGIMAGLLISMMIAVCVLLDEKDKEQ